MSVRSALKALLETGLARSGIARLRWARLARQSLVLAYHNVVPDDYPPCGDRSLHLTHLTFVRQLDHLVRTCSIVPLAEILTTPSPRKRRPRVALTFDDGYRGAATLAVEELAKRGVPATLFIVPAFVGRGGAGGGSTFWWDVIASGGEQGADGEVRGRAIWDLGGQDRAVRRWAAERGLGFRAVPDYAMVATEEELHAAVRHPGITLASHTWSHANLARLPATQLAAELTRPLDWLRQRFESVVPWLSYPYGSSTPAVQAAASAAGYAGALRVGDGWFSPDCVNPYAIPRVNVPSGLSVSGFVALTSGLVRPRP